MTYVQVLQKNVIILFLNKAVFIKKNCYFNIFCEKQYRTTVERPVDHRGTILISWYAFTTVNNVIIRKVN